VSDLRTTTLRTTTLRTATPRIALVVSAVAAMLAIPFYASDFWLQSGLFTMAAAIAAIGLNLLSGTAGQLSMGHAFFVAVGAFGYVGLAGDGQGSGSSRTVGLGLPPALAFVLAIVLAGIAGGLFSPIAGRLRGMYLGIATISLVYLGTYLMTTLQPVTGGYNGRAVPALEAGGFAFDDVSPDGLQILGVPFGGLARLWYLGLALVGIAWFTARNIQRARPGRALIALRDSEVAAGVMGVRVGRHRSAAFIASSMYAGAAGALLALAFGHIVPEHFDLRLSIDYLAMVVIGGLGSVGGAVIGATLVTMLPQIMTAYADKLPFLAAPGSAGSGVSPSDAARYLYGAAIVIVLAFAPRGIAGLFRSHRSGNTEPSKKEPAL
jgi:branched-chain amino acid transport system permease protein